MAKTAKHFDSHHSGKIMVHWKCSKCVNSIAFSKFHKQKIQAGRSCTSQSQHLSGWNFTQSLRHCALFPLFQQSLHRTELNSLLQLERWFLTLLPFVSHRWSTHCRIEYNGLNDVTIKMFQFPTLSFNYISYLTFTKKTSTACGTFSCTHQMVNFVVTKNAN